MAVNEVLLNMLAFSATPGMFIYMLIALSIMSFCIYIFIQFFSKNRFRGISFGIFSKMISLNEYIGKFNDELFEDFNNIVKYNSKQVGNYLYKDSLLNDIGTFMKIDEQGSKLISKDDFNRVMFEFFKPNASFLSSEVGSINENRTALMKSIMERLYRDDFHDRFGIWLNYGSIWNFINKDSKTLLDTLIFNYIRDDVDFKDSKQDYTVYHNKLKDIKKKTTDVEKLNEALVSNEDIDALGNLLKKVVKDEFLSNLGMSEEQRYAIDNILFIGPTRNSRNYGNISQDTFQDEYCSLDDDKLNSGMKTLSEKGLSIDMLNDLNGALSFIDALTVLGKRNYNVSDNMFNSNVNNVDKDLLGALSEANKKSDRQERYMIVHNACYSLFNKLLYFKYTKDSKIVFLFHDNKETVDEKTIKTNKLWSFCQLFFNWHMTNCFRDHVKDAISFMNDTTTFKEVDFITDTHVSIARLKYLIQDYFVIIQQYNDKQYPDEKDIKDFWEKRVNAFGFVVSDTKENKPRDVPDSEYGKAKVNRQRSDNMWEADTEYVLKKNTPVALYFEYLNSVFLEFRHPKIPFFQSIMATIRYLIPAPNVLLDNFLNQIKGKQSAPAPKNPNNYDFSFNYNPYYDGLGGTVDRFEDLEESAKKMSSTIDVGPQGDKIVTASANADSAVGAKTTNTSSQLSNAQNMADDTSKEQGGVDAPAPAPASEKPLVCGPNEKKVKKKIGGGYKCVPKSSADIRRTNDLKKKEEERKTHEKTSCGPNEVASYRIVRGGRQQLVCKAKPTPRTSSNIRKRKK